MAEGSEEENADFYFITRRKLCLAQEVAEVPQSQSLLCVSNKYGVAFAGVKQGVLAVKTSELHTVNTDTSFTNINDIATADKLGGSVLVSMPSPPQHLALSASQQVLSVIGRDTTGQLTLSFYKLQHFFGGGNVFPFASGGVSSKDTVQVVDFCWNPSPDSMLFAFVVESGSVTMVELQGNKLERIASARSIGATAISWSPKGKQLAVGLKDGTVRQYSLSCEVKKDHPVPAGVFTEAVEVKGLYWVSTFTFLVVYCPTGSGNGAAPSAVILNVPKTGDPSAINFDDIFYGTGLGRQQFYFSFLQPWNIILAASSVSNEIAVLAKEKDSETKWTHWLQVDTGRAETPLTADQDDTYPRGMALDLTCMEDIMIGKGDEVKKYPPAPIAMVITNKGVLCPYTAMNLASPQPPNGQPFIAPPQDISLSGEPTVAPQVVDIAQTPFALNRPPPQAVTTATAAPLPAVQLAAPQATSGMPVLLGSSTASQPSPFTLQTSLTSLGSLGGQSAALSARQLPSSFPPITQSLGGTPTLPLQVSSGTQPSFLGLSSMVPSMSSRGQSGLQSGGVFALPGLSPMPTSVPQVSTTSQPSLTTSASAPAFALGNTSLWKTGSTPSLQSSGGILTSLTFRGSAPSQSLSSIATSLPPTGPTLSATRTSTQALGSTPLWLLGSTAAATPLNSGAPLSQPLSSVGLLSQPLSSVAPLSQPLSSVAPLSQPLSSVAPLSQPLSSGAPLGQPLSSVAPLSQPLSSGAPLSQPLSSVAPLGQPLSSSGPLSQPLGSSGPLGQSLSSGGFLVQPLSSGAPLSQPLSSDAPLSQPLSSGAPLSQPLSSGGPLVQPLSSGAPLSQPLSSGGFLVQPLGSGAPLGQPLGSGAPLGQPLGSGAPLGQPLGSGAPLGQPLGSGAPLGQPHGSGAPLGQPLGSGAPLGQPLGSGAPLGQTISMTPLTKGGTPANLPSSDFPSLSTAPTAPSHSSVLSSNLALSSIAQQPPSYTGPSPPAQPTVTAPFSSFAGSALGGIPLAALGKSRAASTSTSIPASSAGVSPGPPTQTSPSAITALAAMGAISQSPGSNVGQVTAVRSTLPTVPTGASYGPAEVAAAVPPGAMPPRLPQPTAMLRPSVLPHSDAASAMGQRPASDTLSAPSMTRMAAAGVHTKAPLVAVQSKQNLDDKYTEEIKKLVETFADSLNDLRERAEAILGEGCFDVEEQSDPAIGTAKERLGLSQDLTEMHSQVEEMKANLQSLKYRVSDCKSQFMDSFAHLEECKSMLNRRREPRLAEYRRRRPLDPVLKGKKDDLLSRHSKLRVTIHELDLQVEDELNRQAGRQLRQAGSGRTLPPPSTQVLYNTLATHRKITMMQSKKLDQLQKKMEKSGLANAWHLSHKRSHTHPQKSRFLKPSLSPGNRYSLDPSLQYVNTSDSERRALGTYPYSSWQVMDDRVQEVTDFLMNIQVTPVKRCPVRTMAKRSSNGDGREADQSPQVEEESEGEGSLEGAGEGQQANLVTGKEQNTVSEPIEHSPSGENHNEDPLLGVIHPQVAGSYSGAVISSADPTATQMLATPQVSVSTDPVKLSYHQVASVQPSAGSYLSQGPRPLLSQELYPPPGGPQPHPSGAYPPPGGPQPHPSGAYPPPGGPQPHPSGAYPPPGGPQPLPSGAYPPPGGPQPHPSGAYPPSVGPQPHPSGAYPPSVGPQPHPSGAYPPSVGPQPHPSGAYPPSDGPQPHPSGAYPPSDGPQPHPSGAYPPSDGPQPHPSGPQPPSDGPQTSPSGPQPHSDGSHPSLSDRYPPASGPQPPPSGPYPPPSGPHPPPSGPYMPPSGSHPPSSGLRSTPPMPHLPQASEPPPSDVPLLTGPYVSGASPLPALALYSKLGITLTSAASSTVMPSLVAWTSTQDISSTGREGHSGVPSSTVLAPLTSLQHTMGVSAPPMPNVVRSTQSNPSPLTASVTDQQQTSAAAQPFSVFLSAQGKDGGGSQPSIPLGSGPPFAAPLGPPSTSVAATLTQSVAPHTIAEVGMKSYPLGRQQGTNGLAAASGKDTESQSQGTDFGSASDLSQEDQALGESQSSVLSHTTGSPSLPRQPPVPFITLIPGTPVKPSAPQTTGAGDKPLPGPSEDTVRTTQQTIPSVLSSQPSTSTGTAASLLAGKPLFGSHLLPAASGKKSPQFMATTTVVSGDGRESPFEQGLHDHGSPSAAQPGVGIQFKSSIQSGDTFLSGDTEGGKNTAKREDAEGGWATSLPPLPSMSKSTAERESTTAGTGGLPPAGANEKQPTSTSVTVPSVTTPLVSSKDAESPPVFGASHMPPLQLKGMPLPVQPGASGVEEKAPVAPLGSTSTTSRSVLPDPLADVGGGAGGDEEAMEETGDARDGGADGLFENMPFMSGLGSSGSQTLPTSSAGSSLLGGGLFSGHSASAATESTASLIQPGRLGSGGGVSSTPTGVFPSAATSTTSAASWWSAVSSPNSSVKLGFGSSLGRMGSSPSLTGQAQLGQSPLLTGAASIQSAPVVPQTGVFAQYAGMNPLAQLRQAGGNPFGWMQQPQPTPAVPLGGGGGGGTTAGFQGSSFTQYRS